MPGENRRRSGWSLWEKIDGQVLWQDKAGANEEVSLSIHRHEDVYGYPGMIGSHAITQTDKEGKFVIEKVLPGKTQLNVHVKVANASTPHLPAVKVDTRMYTHIDVKPGSPTAVVLGGQGRRVSGKLLGLDSWQDVTLDLSPPAPRIGLRGDGERRKQFDLLAGSAIGPILFRKKVPVNADGSFVIEGVLPGRYRLTAWTPGDAGYGAFAWVEIAAEVPAQQPADVDLGVIEGKRRGN